MTNKTYSIALSNDTCIFDSADGFSTPEEAIEWGMGRGTKYSMQIASNEDELAVIISCKNGKLSYYNGCVWENLTTKGAADLAR